MSKSSFLEPHHPKRETNLRRFRITSRGVMDRIFPVLMVIMGVLQLYVFAILYHKVDLKILGCLSALAGTVLQITGMIKLYSRARTANSARILISLLVGCTGLYSWFFVYYGLLLVRQIFWITCNYSKNCNPPFHPDSHLHTPHQYNKISCIYHMEQHILRINLPHKQHKCANLDY